MGKTKRRVNAATGDGGLAALITSLIPGIPPSVLAEVVLVAESCTDRQTLIAGLRGALLGMRYVAVVGIADAILAATPEPVAEEDGPASLDGYEPGPITVDDLAVTRTE